MGLHPTPSNLMRFFLSLAAVSLQSVLAENNQFDPYQLNGGLVAAVAGRDFVVVAADTRMIGRSGYDILERHHVSSRLWSATDAASIPAIEDDATASTFMFLADGAVKVKLDPGDKSSKDSLNLQLTENIPSSSPLPVLVASSGCSADCEMLKRTIRADLRAAHYFSESRLQPQHVSTLLSQVLYSRRGFPFYSFCLVAGIEENEGGRVHVFDAIGSHEQVAVATAGTGRELLQPILDRKFSSQKTEKISNERIQRLGAIPLTKVDCTVDEAVSILVQGYRAVSEREIGVGDQVILCALQKDAQDSSCSWKVYTAPLKKH